MKHKVESFLLMVLPIIAAFNYVVAHQMMQDARATNVTTIFEQFYFIVISTGIFHLIWLINIILICMKAFDNVRFWRILTTFIIFQVILLYGLGVYMSLFLCKYVYLRDMGVSALNLNYYITWSAVAVGCLWFDFIIWLLIVTRHVFQHEEFSAVRLEDPSRVERV